MIKKTLRYMICSMVILSSYQSGPAFAEDKPFEKTAAGKASKELIKQFTTLVKDVNEMNAMSDEEKVKYILTKGKERIYKQTEKSVKEALKSKIVDYAKAKLRSDLFKAEVPSIMHQAIVEGKNVGALWSQADLNFKIKIDGQINAIKAGMDAVEIGWDVISAWNKGGATKGLAKLGEKIGDKISAYFIPGWGYYRLAQDLVKALGEYVVGYAFDTALEAKMKVVLGANDPKMNPRAFADWIMNVDINSHVQREWDEQVGVGGWYLKGAGNEGEDMKNSIIAELNKLKEDIVQKKQVEAEVKSRLEQLDADERRAESQVKDVADKAVSESAPAVAVIDGFMAQIYGFKKEDAKEKIGEEKKDYDDALAKDSAVPMAARYEPLDHASVLEPLKNALAEIRGPGDSGGYDQEEMKRLYDEYQAVRKRVIEESSAKIAKAIAASSKVVEALNAQYAPQLNAISAQIQNSKTEGERHANEAQYNSVSNALSQALRPHYNVMYSHMLEGEQAKDIEVLAAEEQIVYLDAAERGEKMKQDIEEKVSSIQERLQKALEEYSKARQEISTGVENLNFPYGWKNAEYFEKMANSLGYDPANHYEWAGDVGKDQIVITELKKRLSEDAAKAELLHKKEKESFEKYTSVMDEVIGEFGRDIPRNLKEEEGKPSGNVFKTLSMKQFWMPGGGEIIPGFGLTIYQPWGERTREEYAKDLASPPFQAELVTAAAGKLLSEVSNLVHADDLAVSFLRIYERVCEDRVMILVRDIKFDQESKRADEMLPYQFNDSAHMFVVPEKSKCAEYLVQLKAAWKTNEGYVNSLDNLRKGIGNQVKYRHKFQENAFPVLDAWLTVPERIKIFEEAYERGKKSYEERTALVERYLAENRQEFEKIIKETAPADRAGRIKNVLDYAKSTAHLTKIWLTYGGSDRLKKVNDGWTKLAEDAEKATKEAKEAAEKEKRRNAEEWRRQEEERKKKEEEGRKKKEEEDRERRKSSYGASFARINGQPSQNMSGDIRLTKDDLPRGTIDIATNLTTLDGVTALFISEDGGRTWKELPKNRDVNYSIQPTPRRQYKPMLKVKADADEVILDITPNITSIIFDDTDFQQLVAGTIKKIADSYEGKNISAFIALISKDFLGNRTFLEDGVRRDFDTFDSIRLSLYLNRIEKRKDIYAVEMKWNKSQMVKKTGKQQQTTGNTTMMFVFEDGAMKIQNLRGDLIYATLSPEIAEASGLGTEVIDGIKEAVTEGTGAQPGAGGGDTGAPGPGGPAGPAKAAGTLSTGAFTLTQYKLPHPPNFDIEGYNFASRSKTRETAPFPVGSDFRRREGWMESRSGIVDMGSVGMDNVDEAPASGYDAQAGGVSGHTYAVRLSDGSYALVEVASLGESYETPNSSTFNYKHQRNGTRSFK